MGIFKVAALLLLPGLFGSVFYTCIRKHRLSIAVLYEWLVFSFLGTLLACGLKYAYGTGDNSLYATFCDASALKVLVAVLPFTGCLALFLSVVLPKKSAHTVENIFRNVPIFAVLPLLTVFLLVPIIRGWQLSAFSVLTTVGGFTAYGLLATAMFLLSVLLFKLFYPRIFDRKNDVNSDGALHRLYAKEKLSLKSRALFAALVDIGFIFSVLLFIPFETYLANAGEFSFTFAKFWIIPTAEGLCLFVLLFIVQISLCGALYRVAVSSVFGVTLSCYVQAMFLNGNMQRLDGSDAVWTTSQITVNAIIWFGIVLAVIAFSLFAKKIWHYITSFGSVLIAGMQLVAMVSLLLNAAAPNISTKITNKNLYTVSPEKNTIVFILDRFDQRFMDETLASYPDALDGLHGFTYYTNATGAYSFTHIAVPYLLEGTKIPEYNPTKKQFEDAFVNSSFFHDLADKATSIGVYTDEWCIQSNEARSFMNNCIVVDYSLDRSTILKYTHKQSFFRALPFLLKAKFAYTSTDLNSAITLHDGSDYSTYECSCETQSELCETLKTSGLTADETSDSNCFRFIHVPGTHPAWHINADGSYNPQITDRASAGRGSLEMVSAYLANLQKLGVYEQSEIIITADHGETFVVQNNTLDEPAVNPILLYKPAGKRYTDPMTTSTAPVSHEDIFPTVIRSLGGDYTNYGSALDEIGESVQRTRYFYWPFQDTEITSGESCIHVEYAINGNAADKRNWTQTENRVYPNDNPRHADITTEK